MPPHLFHSKITQAVTQTVKDLQFINLTILFRPFGLLAPKRLYYLAF